MTTRRYVFTALQAGTVALALASFSSCKVIDAMDNTETMKGDLAAMRSITQGMSSTTGGMKDGMDGLKQDAKLLAGIQMLKEAAKSDKDYITPSGGLLAGATAVGEAATNEQFMKYFNTQLIIIKDSAPNESRMVDGQYPRSYIDEFNFGKNMDLTIAKALAGLLSQDRLVSLLQEQIGQGGGAYSDEAYQLLMLRARFLNDFLIDKISFRSKVDTIGKLRNAHEYVRQLQFIADLPYADKISYSTDKFLPLPPSRGNCKPGDESEECQPTDTNYRFELMNPETKKVEIAKPWWKKLVRVIDRDVPAEFKDSNSPYAREIAEIREEALRHSEQQ